MRRSHKRSSISQPFHHCERRQIMSTSLRDQMLKAGLINKKQANEAERQLQRQERQPSKHKSAVPHERPIAPQTAQAAKVARDHALNRQQQENAAKKARLAQVKQLIEQNHVPP